MKRENYSYEVSYVVLNKTEDRISRYICLADYCQALSGGVVAQLNEVKHFIIMYVYPYET